MTKDPILQTFEQTEQDRQNWESLWQDIAELVLPRRDFVTHRSKGVERNNRIFDATAQASNSMLAAGLQQFMVNSQSKWFQLRVPGIENEDENREAAQWLGQVRDLMLAEFNSPEANFYPTVHEGFMDVTAFGTMSFFVQATSDGRPSFQSRPLPEAFIQENSKGKIDTYFRKYKLSIRQAVQEFGAEALRQSRAVSKELDKGDLSKEHEFVQAVMPNTYFDATKHEVSSNKPWLSVHILNEAEKPRVKFSGFDQFPFIVSRWAKVTGETYGRSPAMQVLPDIRMLQEMSKTIIKSAQKVVDPPLQVPDDGFLNPIRMHPGGLNYKRAGTQERIEPIITQGRVDVGIDMIRDRQAAVQQAFMLDALQGILNRGNSSPLKATEVAARQSQALRQLAPVVSRLQNEFLGPLIDRVFAIMLKEGKLPEPPASIQGQDLNVEFVSQAATAAQASDADNILNWMEQILPMVNLDPQAAANVNVDASVRKLAELNNVPPELLSAPEEVQQVRQQATQSEQNQQLAQLLKDGGPGLKALADSSETLQGVGSRNNEQ